MIRKLESFCFSIGWTCVNGKPTIQMEFITVITQLILMAMLLATTATSNFDYYLLNCGKSTSTDASTSSLDNRIWNSDNNSTFSTNFSSTIVASTITAYNVDQTPFSTARIFTSNFTYSFPVTPGPKFIRLYFYPSIYNSEGHPPFSATEPYITVETNTGHVLLRNFSAYLSVNSSSGFIQKEFYIPVSSSHFQLTFVPTKQSSYAFINGIEVVSVPENLYLGGSPPKNMAAQNTEIDLIASTALENAYRVNVGGQDVNRNDDSGNMYRLWESDDKYLFRYKGEVGLDSSTGTIKYMTNYSAPADVYQTFRSMGRLNNTVKSLVNVSWGFEVDFGFSYLVRLHWCEVVKDINHTDYRVFNVYIDQQSAENALDIFEQYGSHKAVFRDYYVTFTDGENGRDTKAFLQLDLHPDFNWDPMFYDILLNGVEIFKISRPDNRLDAPNPSRLIPATSPINQIHRKKTSSNLIPAIIGTIASAILLAVILSFLFIFRRRKWSKMSAGSSGTTSSKSKRFLISAKSDGTTQRSSAGGSLPSHLCRYFSLADIRNATSDFSGSLIIGHGGFGNVYKGTVNSDTGPITVAIKRLNPLSGQGAREFTTEIELLSKLRHLHLVSLIGYCDEAGEMILVYEFMSHGTLRDHLYPSNTDHKTEIPWCQRLEICIGAARGLHYLHTGTERMIIHRDVKSTNILLDEKWVAKVSDFGLSKLGPTGTDYSHVSTAVKGSFGYVDPEYYRRQQLTEKSDVYSFGVVLFEVLCARAAVNPTLPKEQVNLRIWARRNQVSGTLDTIVDPALKGQIAPESLRKFGEVAECCVRDEGAQRPSMADVIWGLEFALQLQTEAEAKSTVDENDVVATNITSPTTDTTIPLITSSGDNTWTTMNDTSSGLYSSTTSVGYGDGSTDVFSQMFKPEGR